jgi:ribosome-associated protein
MDVTLQTDNSANAGAVLLARLLAEHKGGDVVILDLRGQNTWTDFFVIATVTSNTHLQGLARQVQDFAGANGLEIIRKSRKPLFRQSTADTPEDEWRLIDMGTLVVHLMTAQSRSFYELERLWGSASVIPY